MADKTPQEIYQPLLGSQANPTSTSALNDLGAAAKCFARAKLLNRDREVILEKERALGLVKAER